MEEYNRDSLRAYRREQEAGRKERKKNKGSKWITLLIILLFIVAGIFYLHTEHSAWIRDFFTSKPLSGEESSSQSVHATVDGVLAERNEVD